MTDKTPHINPFLVIPVLLSGSITLALCFTLISPIIPMIADAFTGQVDDPLFFAQTVIAYAATGMVFGGPLGGWLAGIFGARRILLVALAIFSIAGAAGFFIGDPLLLLVSRVTVGAAACALQTCCMSLTGDYFTGDRRVRIISLIPAAGAVSAIASILLAGEVAAAWGWPSVYLMYLFAVPFLLVALFALPRPAPAPKTHESISEPTLSLYLPLWYLFLLMAATSMLLNLPSVQLPIKLAADGYMDSSLNARLVACFSVTLSISAIAYSNLRRHLGVNGIFIAGLLVVGVGYIALGYTSTPIAIGLAAALAGIGGGLLNPHFSVLMLEKAPEAIRTQALGLLMACFFFGEFIIPYTFNPLRVAFGIDQAFMVVGMTACLAALPALLLGLKRPQRSTTSAK